MRVTIKLRIPFPASVIVLPEIEYIIGAGVGVGIGDGVGVGVCVGVGVGVAIGVGVGVATTWPEHGVKGELVLRGFGAPIVKSLALLLVSVHPLFLRKAAAPELKPVTEPPPSKQFVDPNPTKSNNPVAPSGQLVNILLFAPWPVNASLPVTPKNELGNPGG